MEGTTLQFPTLASHEGADPDAVKRWRKATRQVLLARRLAVAEDDHRRWSGAINRDLERGFANVAGLTVSFYWPYQREFDVLPLIRQLLIRGATCALPVVVAPRTPLVFRQWDVDTKMGTGVYDIPMPLDTAEVSPDVVIAPLHGFDPRGFRLGYGSGYFDRTLAALQNRPITVGVGFEISRLDSIYPQSHDIPLDFIVTEAGARRSPAGGMQAGGAQKATDAFRVGPSANFNGEVGQQARRL